MNTLDIKKLQQVISIFLKMQFAVNYLPLFFWLGLHCILYYGVLCKPILAQVSATEEQRERERERGSAGEHKASSLRRDQRW